MRHNTLGFRPYNSSFTSANRAYKLLQLRETTERERERHTAADTTTYADEKEDDQDHEQDHHVWHLSSQQQCPVHIEDQEQD